MQCIFCTTTKCYLCITDESSQTSSQLLQLEECLKNQLHSLNELVTHVDHKTLYLGGQTKQDDDPNDPLVTDMKMLKSTIPRCYFYCTPSEIRPYGGIESFYHIQEQPEPYQRKSYPNKKEMRHFKPAMIQLVPRKETLDRIQFGHATMKITDDDKESMDEEVPGFCEMDTEFKMFCFTPFALNTRKSNYLRLQFTINLQLNNGELKTEIVTSNRFRVVSRITAKHQSEMYHNVCC